MTPGWFRVYRDDLTKMDLTEGAAWVWLQGLARFKRGDGLAKGEFVMSRTALAVRYGWTESKARRFLGRLVREGLIKPTANRPPNRPHKANVYRVCIRQADHPTGQEPTTIEEGRRQKNVVNGEAEKAYKKIPPSEGGSFH